METRHQRLRRLIEPHHERALAFARHLCRSRAEGDDLFQEALLRALGKLDGLRDDGAFRSWLYRVISTVHVGRCRRAFWRRLLPLGDTDEAASSEPAADDALGGAQRARRALASLPPDQRETIVLFELEGWLVEEIAALHGSSLSCVKSQLARGRERLRTYYRRELGETELAALAPGDAP